MEGETVFNGCGFRDVIGDDKIITRYFGKASTLEDLGYETTDDVEIKTIEPKEFSGCPQKKEITFIGLSDKIIDDLKSGKLGCLEFGKQMIFLYTKETKEEMAKLKV